MSLKMWLDASKGDQNCALSDALVLDDWFSEFDAAVSTLRTKAESGYEQNIDKPLKVHQREVISAASEVCDSWRSMHHTSFRAFIANFGTHYTRAAGSRCWNTELVDCLNDITDQGWLEMDRLVEEVRSQLGSLFRQAFQSMLEELRRAQAPDLLMDNFVHREAQVSEVLAANLNTLRSSYSILKRLATTGGRPSFVLDYMSPVYARCLQDSGKFSSTTLLLKLMLTHTNQEQE